jgi:hypothetical protein
MSIASEILTPLQSLLLQIEAIPCHIHSVRDKIVRVYRDNYEQLLMITV